MIAYRYVRQRPSDLQRVASTLPHLPLVKADFEPAPSAAQTVASNRPLPPSKASPHASSKPANHDLKPPGITATAQSALPAPDPLILLNWDPWPDGDFERDFTYEEFAATKDLQVHWACAYAGSSRASGSKDAEHYLQGRMSRRMCLGIVVCDNDACKYVIRPLTKAPDKKVGERCPGCGDAGTLRRIRCSATQRIYKYKHGVHFKHEGVHSHVHLEYLLHLTTSC